MAVDKIRVKSNKIIAKTDKNMEEMHKTMMGADRIIVKDNKIIVKAGWTMVEMHMTIMEAEKIMEMKMIIE